VLVTRAAVGAIFHLSKIDSIRAGHTYANDKILAITRNRCYARIAAQLMKGEINIYIKTGSFEIKYEMLFSFCFQYAAFTYHT